MIPFTLALLSIRAKLEATLKNNNHMSQSSIIYFNFINNILSNTQEHFKPPLRENKDFVSNLSDLLQTIRPCLLTQVENAITLLKNIITWLKISNDSLTPFHQQLCVFALVVSLLTPDRV